jgi:hypothetical protein
MNIIATYFEIINQLCAKTPLKRVFRYIKYVRESDFS